ncbi:MAG TPA: serpin family protein [Allosphingosinicella sp.]|jgi:serpin B
MHRLPYFATVLALGAAACTAPPSEPAQTEAAPPAEFAETVPPSEARPALVAGNAEFAVDLYRRLGSGNLFFSPIGISTAFGMVQAGARGETGREIAQAMRFRLGGEQLHATLGPLARELAIDQPGRRLAVANALWVQTGYPLLPAYTQTLGTHYGAPPTSLDFEDDRAGAAAAISRWAEQNTNGRIRNLLAPDDLHPRTRLVLTNTVWFKADWQREFEAAATRERDFFVPAGPPVKVRMMHEREARFRHLDGGSFDAIELPYRGEEMSMLVFLPKARDGLPAFERELTGARLSEWTNALRAAEHKVVDLALPKIELRTRYDLPAPLKEMGMRLVYTDHSDLSGISNAERLMIDRAIHQTFLLVDEKGTEAAAATAITIRPVSAPPTPQVRFHADHPFFFLIRDNRSGALLFMGRIEAPSAPRTEG